ncbi:cation diffusion facilitator family transporter [Nocardioides carbamazepini]|uniref:cation diffusion facilitator family transporter n=1 Tax=Nocardioides carbamazepini TaxID=2854259 RepID=UPI00214A240F|nr:cation diffusion facilitator family transporter [Nocardioides carbamazepini]MCR1781330.1 cation diffusion facilitator family transporter [Nocardioides carbamazepini]
MGAGHGHGHAGGRHRWRLALAFGLVGSFFGVELAVGLWSGSLALLSDAGHMAADVVALGAALAATRIATMTDRTGRKTFGSYRAEVFASGLTVLLMLGAGAYVAIEGIKRIGETVELESGAVMLVGAIGLLINLVALGLLRGGAGESINVKGAYLEVVADTVGSVGVIAAGLMIALTGSAWWDTGIALAIAAFVVVRALMLGREVLSVLGQHAPAGMDPAEVEATLVAVDGVAEVHDLHLWALTSGMNVATAHLVAAPGASRDVLVAAQATLREKYGVDHATLQVESDATACNELSW